MATTKHCLYSFGKRDTCNLINLKISRVSIKNFQLMFVLLLELVHVGALKDSALYHRGPTQSVWVANCYFIVNVLDLPCASPMAIYR